MQRPADKLIATTEEVDYTEMLDWFGLRFMTGDAIGLDPRSPHGRHAAQKDHFAALMSHSKAK